MDKDEDAFGKRCDDAEINLTTVVAFLFWSRTNCPARRLRVHSKCVLNMLFSLLLQVHPLVSSFERCVCVCASVQRPKSKDGNGQIDLLYVVCMQVYCSHSDAHTLLLFMSLPSSCHYQSVLFALHESVTTKHEPYIYVLNRGKIGRYCRCLLGQLFPCRKSAVESALDLQLDKEDPDSNNKLGISSIVYSLWPICYIHNNIIIKRLLFI